MSIDFIERAREKQNKAKLREQEELLQHCANALFENIIDCAVLDEQNDTYHFA